MFKKQNETCTEISVRKAARFLKQKDNYIILTHASPDGDTLGCAFALFYALKDMGKKVCVMCPDELPNKFDYFTTQTDVVPENNATVISVDVADLNLLGDLREKFADRIELAIDHHISNKRFSKMLLLDINAAAACQIIYLVLKSMGAKITDIIAKCLYTGIATDTGCFKYQNVTAQTHIIASKLIEFNINSADINKKMFDTKSKNLLTLERMVLDSAEYHFCDKCMLLTVTEEMQKETGCKGPDLDGIAVISRSVEGVICGITIKQNAPETFKISMRTYAPLDASVICASLGGGGHKAAAGATLTGTLKDVKEQVLQSVKQAMEEANVGISSC